MVLISVQVCSGAKVIRNCGLLPVSEDLTLLAVFQALYSGQIESPESPDGWRLLEEYANSPISCMVAPKQSGKFQSTRVLKFSFYLDGTPCSFRHQNFIIKKLKKNWWPGQIFLGEVCRNLKLILHGLLVIVFRLLVSVLFPKTPYLLYSGGRYRWAGRN